MTNRAHRFTAQELALLPTLAVGQADGISYELKHDCAGMRIWTDGSQVVVEQATGNPQQPWKEVDRYAVEESSNGNQTTG